MILDNVPTPTHDGTRISLSTTKADEVIKYLPSAVAVPGGVNVVWDQPTAELLAAMNIAAVSPILRDFDFPGKFEPMPHQYAGASELACHMRIFDLSTMGTGKTAKATWAAKYLLDTGRIKRVLIVGPLTILDVAWKAEVFAIDTRRPATVVHHPTADKRRKLMALDTAYKIMNFDGVGILQKEILAWDPDLIIVDESRAYANAGTARWKALAPIAKKARRMWMMSGTPTVVSPMDAHGQVKLIMPGNLPSSKFQFRDMVMRQNGPFSWVPRHDAWQTVNRYMQPAIRVDKKDVLKDLPPVTYTYRYVAMSAQQKAFYEELRKQQTFTLDSGEAITAVHAASLYTKLAQIASGCVYAEDGTVVTFDVKARINEMIDIISQADEAVLVFVPYRHTLEMLEPYLHPLGFKSIHGGVTDRAQIIDELQAGKIKGILATPSTLSHGVTLTKANVTIWFSPVNKSEVYLQSNARMDRPGQKNAMTIVHLFGSPAERNIYKSLQGQVEGQDTMLSMFSNLFKGE